MLLYRISKCQFINDLTGYGASLCGGRWNSRGVYMLYTSESPALALLENVVNNALQFRINFCQLTLEIPDDTILSVNTRDLPEHWDVYPSPEILKVIGDTFIKNGNALALKVPAAVMSGQWNYIINPLHTDAAKIKIVKKETISVDSRLRHRTRHGTTAV